MDKKTILLRKIKENEILEKMDEVAVEHQLIIQLKNGNKVDVTCTPSYLDELILGRRYLLDDLSEQELGKLSIGDNKEISTVSLENIFRIVAEMFENPGSLFRDTGCAHSCVLVKDGEILCSMEDIGRHNALDKVIGYAVENQIPFAQSIIFTSGRISRDYLQKVVKAGFKIAVSRAAVTDGAVELAKEKDITLLGFIRKNTGNVYHEGIVKIK